MDTCELSWHRVKPTSQDDSTLLAWQSGLFKLDLLDVLSRHDYQTHITTVPRYVCRRISRLLNGLANGLSRWCTVLIRKCKDDVAVL